VIKATVMTVIQGIEVINCLQLTTLNHDRFLTESCIFQKDN